LSILHLASFTYQCTRLGFHSTQTAGSGLWPRRALLTSIRCNNTGSSSGRSSSNGRSNIFSNDSDIRSSCRDSQPQLSTESQLRNFLIKASKSDWDQYKLTEALFPQPLHGTESGVFFGWQEGAAGTDSSRDKE
jgi:hypothetical protein